MVGDAIVAVDLTELGTKRHARLIGIEEVTEAVALLVLAGRVVGWVRAAMKMTPISGM